MPLPSSGAISLSNVASIIKGSATASIRMGDTETRLLTGNNTGVVSLGSARGKPDAGSASYTSPGAYTFLVLPYETLSVDVRGAGGGGGAGCDHWYGLYRYNGNAGTNGTPSIFLDLFSEGGTGGRGGGTGFLANDEGSPGTPGNAYGGDTNTTGGGSAGGLQNNGGGPSAIAGGPGGAGGQTTKNYTGATPGRPTYGQSVTVHVGYAGFGGTGTSPYANYSGSPGTQGAVYISWS